MDRTQKNKRTIFIGNTFSLSEYKIIALFKPFGNIKSVNYLWHTAGPHKGKPRGFCFVEFERVQDAEQAIKNMNGKKVDGVVLTVRYATEDSDHLLERKGVVDSADSPKSIPITTLKGGVDDKIKAIEEKLKRLKRAQIKDEDVHDTTKDSKMTLQSSKRHKTSPKPQDNEVH